MYNYYDSMKSDILDRLSWDYSIREILEKLEDAESWKEQLNAEYWIDDNVTGNASGSYTFNSYQAREYVTENGDLLREALTEFCTEPDTIAEHFLSGDWEYFDVTIRCYILWGAIDDLIDDLASCQEALEAEAETISEYSSAVREALENAIAAA